MKRHTAAHRDATTPKTDLSEPLLQRACNCGGSCERCAKKRLQRSAARGSGAAVAPPSVTDVIRSSGKPLDAGVRTNVEQQFGRDFSRVRVHDDGRAAESAESVGAKAYTVGRDIVFNAGRYAPGTATGDRLLRHELTHVLQQRNVGESTSSPIEIGKAGDAYEREADAVARAGERAQPPVSERTPHARLQGAWYNTLWNAVVDVLAFIPRLFGAEWFTADQLQQYLDGLRQRKTIEDGWFSDNKARACVSRESEFGPYDTDTKILLVREMSTGHVSFLDEGAINTLLARATPQERQRIVNAIGRDALWSTFSGRNRRILEALTMTAADANNALIDRLRTLNLDELEDYRTFAVDPALQKAIQQAITLSQITADVPTSAVIGASPAQVQLPGGPVPATAATFQINGVPVFAYPDIIDSSLGDVAFTDMGLFYTTPHPAPPESADIKVGAFNVPEIRLGIRTRYGSKDAPGKEPAYGVGTRAGDKPTTRFHERAHSQAWFAFLQKNPPPQFTGQSGMTNKAFDAAVVAWKTEAEAWHDRAQKFSIQTTDCVGKLPSAEALATLHGAGFTTSLCTQQPTGAGH